jgi:predicted RNase H-like HicB family nuclease
MTEKNRTFTMLVERDSAGYWIGELAEEPRCHTFGRSLAKLRENMREAASLWFEMPEGRIHLEEKLVLPDAALHAVQSAQESRQVSEAYNKLAAHQTAVAAQTLKRAGVSFRDAADLLGLSHQRVQQLAQRRTESKSRLRLASTRRRSGSSTGRTPTTTTSLSPRR